MSRENSIKSTPACAAFQFETLDLPLFLQFVGVQVRLDGGIPFADSCSTLGSTLAQIFHRSANSLAKVSIAAVLAAVARNRMGGLQNQCRNIHHRRGCGSRAARSL